MLVAVGGTLVFVGIEVFVGGTPVFVGAGVFVGIPPVVYSTCSKGAAAAMPS